MPIPDGFDMKDMKDKSNPWILSVLLPLASIKAILQKIRRRVSLFTAGSHLSSPAKPKKATFLFLYSSPGLRCWGKRTPLEEEGQVYVHIGEGG